MPFALSVRIAEYVGICGVLLCFFSFVSWMVIMSGCSSVTRSFFNSSCLFVMLLIFSCRSVKSFLLWCDVVACECVVELSVVVWVVRAEGGSLRFWGPGLLSMSPAFSMSSASHSAGSSGRLAQKTGAGPTGKWAGKSWCHLSIQIGSSKATACRLHLSLQRRLSSSSSSDSKTPCKSVKTLTTSEHTHCHVHNAAAKVTLSRWLLTLTVQPEPTPDHQYPQWNNQAHHTDNVKADNLKTTQPLMPAPTQTIC